MPTEYKVQGNKKLALISEVFILIAAITWGGEYIVAKIALDSISPLWLNTLRFGIGWLLLMGILYKKAMTIRWHHLKVGAFAAIFMFGGFATQLIAIKYTTASNAAFLTTIYVVIIPIYVWMIYRKRPSGFAVFAGILSVAGAGLLSLQGDFTINLGDSLAILAAALFAADICVVEYFIKRGMDPLVMTLCQMGTVAIISLLTALIFEPLPTQMPSGVIFSIVYMVLLGAVFTQLVFNIAMKYTTSTKAAIINSTEAVFGFIFAVIFLGDLVTVRNVLGGACIFIAVIIAETELVFIRDILARFKYKVR